MWSGLVGTTLDGNLTLERLLGRGAFGAVFLAQQKLRDTSIRRLAVKIVPIDMDHVEEQIAELKVAVNFDHPCVIRSYGVGESRVLVGPGARDVLHLQMEVASESLLDRIRRVPLTADETLEVAFDVASALHYLHSRRSIHRDLKPGNVLRVGHRWKLSDFGLVRYLGASRIRDGFPVGTRRYISPEAYEGEQSSAWDMWSLGLTLAHAHLGRLPFVGDGPEFVRAISKDDPDLPNDLPYPLVEIITGCLEKSPVRRLTAHRVLELLEDAGIKNPSSHTNTLVVSSDGTSAYSSIAAALADAGRGDRVIVRRGTYRESLVVDRPVELVGDGKASDIVVESQGRPALLLQAHRAAIRGLTFSAVRGEGAPALGDASVMVVRGRPTLESCLVFSELPAGVTVRGAASAPVLLKCAVWGAKECGVHVYDRASPVVDGCLIRNSGRVGIWLSDEADPIVRACEVTGSGTRGVFVAESALGTFDRCRVFENRGPGVEIAARANPMFQRCDIVKNDGAGIEASGGAGGVIRECRILDNSKGAWRAHGRETVTWLSNQPESKRGQ